MEKIKSVFFRTFLITTSSCVSLLAIIVLINMVLEYRNIHKENVLFDLELKIAKFSPKNIYWDKPYCLTSKTGCTFEEEEELPDKVIRFHPKQSTGCRSKKKILFLGDSFVVGPWVKDEDVFTSVFSQLFSDQYDMCVDSYKLATRGAGPDQEFEAFISIKDKIRPDIVIWQFFYNDVYDNVKQAVYDVKKQQLVKRNTLTNALFWAGYANQHLPLLAETTVGKYFMATAASNDVFRSWPVDINNKNQLYRYFKEKFTKELESMKAFSKQNLFVWYTTLIPLECEVYSVDMCPKRTFDDQNLVRTILKNNSSFLSLDTMKEAEADSGVGEYMFESTRDTAPWGVRHFSRTGNAIAGELLFQQYLPQGERSSEGF